MKNVKDLLTFINIIPNTYTNNFNLNYNNLYLKLLFF